MAVKWSVKLGDLLRLQRKQRKNIHRAHENTAYLFHLHNYLEISSSDK